MTIDCDFQIHFEVRPNGVAIFITGEVTPRLDLKLMKNDEVLKEQVVTEGMLGDLVHRSTLETTTHIVISEIDE